MIHLNYMILFWNIKKKQKEWKTCLNLNFCLGEKLSRIYRYTDGTYTYMYIVHNILNKYFYFSNKGAKDILY